MTDGTLTRRSLGGPSSQPTSAARGEQKTTHRRRRCGGLLLSQLRDVHDHAAAIPLRNVGVVKIAVDAPMYTLAVLPTTSRPRWSLRRSASGVSLPPLFWC